MTILFKNFCPAIQRPLKLRSAVNMTRPSGYNKNFILNSAEHEILPANKQQVVFLLCLDECKISYAYEYENANN